MANPVKKVFLDELSRRFGRPKQLPGSLSLFEFGDGLIRIYIRYSKVHPGKRLLRIRHRLPPRFPILWNYWIYATKFCLINRYFF